MHNVDKRPTALVVLTAIVLIGVIACLGGCSTTHPKGQPAKAGAIEEVSRVRRLLRAACGRLKAVNEGAADRATQMAEAGSETAGALELWRGFLEGCAGRPPQAYASHPQWVAATAEISNGIAEMLKQVEQDNPDMAFKACGAACGKFVALNEQAGVRRTSDVLFSFRKAAKPLAEPVAKGNLEAVSAKVRQLTEIRDKAMMEPVGGTGTAEQKAQALKAFSEAVDAFASIAAQGDRAMLDAQYRAMMSAMERAYDLFL
jgi:hypothetical protein